MMRVTVNGLATIARGTLPRENVMSPLADPVGGEGAGRFGRLGSRFKVDCPAAVEGVRSAVGDAPSGRVAGSEREECRVTMDSQIITGWFVDPRGRPFEAALSVGHAGSVRCSVPVGGSTRCTAARS
jgi:hypothetical protein